MAAFAAASLSGAMTPVRRITADGERGTSRAMRADGRLDRSDS
jgi:hypothetical protein